MYWDTIFPTTQTLHYEVNHEEVFGVFMTGGVDIAHGMAMDAWLVKLEFDVDRQLSCHYFPPSQTQTSIVDHYGVFRTGVVDIDHGIAIRKGLVGLEFDIVKHLGYQLVSSDRWCMLWSCFMMGQVFGSDDGLLYSGSIAYDEMGILFGSFPLVALAKYGGDADLSDALRLEAFVGLAAMVVIDGSSSLENEFASMVLDMVHPVLEFFLPVPSHHNMFHILSAKEGQGFVYDIYLLEYAICIIKRLMLECNLILEAGKTLPKIQT